MTWSPGRETDLAKFSIGCSQKGLGSDLAKLLHGISLSTYSFLYTGAQLSGVRCLAIERGKQALRIPPRTEQQEQHHSGLGSLNRSSEHGTLDRTLPAPVAPTCWAVDAITARLLLQPVEASFL